MIYSIAFFTINLILFIYVARMSVNIIGVYVKNLVILNFCSSSYHRGSLLAEFLTDGDPQGDLKKSVEDLHRYHPKAHEMCRKLATHYSKQLFTIYHNKEDPFFHS